jgi:hypothetical protein
MIMRKEVVLIKNLRNHNVFEPVSIIIIAKLQIPEKEKALSNTSGVIIPCKYPIQSFLSKIR